MFGYVPQSQLDEEHRLRIEAQTVSIRESRLAMERLDTIQEYRELHQLAVSANDQLRIDHQAAMQNLLELHARQMSELLQHIAPLAPSNPFIDTDPLSPITAEEIMQTPVSGKRAMEIRDLAAAAARQREMSEADRKAQKRRWELIQTDEEKRANLMDFDSTLGISQPKPAESALNGIS